MLINKFKISKYKVSYYYKSNSNDMSCGNAEMWAKELTSLILLLLRIVLFKLKEIIEIINYYFKEAEVFCWLWRYNYLKFKLKW